MSGPRFGYTSQPSRRTGPTESLLEGAPPVPFNEDDQRQDRRPRPRATGHHRPADLQVPYAAAAGKLAGVVPLLKRPGQRFGDPAALAPHVQYVPLLVLENLHHLSIAGQASGAPVLGFLRNPCGIRLWRASAETFPTSSTFCLLIRYPACNICSHTRCRPQRLNHLSDQLAVAVIVGRLCDALEIRQAGQEGVQHGPRVGRSSHA